jgi:MFS family permease
VAGARPEGRRRRPWALAGLGAIAACAALGEGAMADWSALFLRDERGAGAGAAALGYAAFAVAMTAGRLGGEAAIRRVGAAAALRAGASAATLGIVVAVVVASPLAGMAGFALVGLGLSCAFPLALTTAGESGDGAGSSEIAKVSVVGYLGFLLGPPLVGFVADQVGLRGAVLAVALPALGLAVLAGAVDPGRWHDDADVPRSTQRRGQLGVELGEGTTAGPSPALAGPCTPAAPAAAAKACATATLPTSTTSRSK